MWKLLFLNYLGNIARGEPLAQWLHHRERIACVWCVGGVTVRDELEKFRTTEDYWAVRR